MLSTSRVTAALIVPAFSLIVLGAGCGGSGTTVNPLTNTITSEDQAGNTLVAGDNATIPANFPSDFPQYPGAKTIFAYTVAQDQSGSLMQETQDTLEQTQTNIERLMQTQGYEKVTTSASPDIVILSFKKDTVRFQVNIARQASGTQIQSVRAVNQGQ
ncbi:hypothetical protein KBB27_00780 [Patescibacteria group bacterium]|nr:hypothetical protein [Patescibacteria group bacterium]